MASNLDDALNAAVAVQVEKVDRHGHGRLVLVADDGRELVNIKLPKPAFAKPQGDGQTFAYPIPSGTAAADGRAVAYRVEDGLGDVVFSGPVAKQGSKAQAGAMVMDNVDLTLGGTVNVSTFGVRFELA